MPASLIFDTRESFVIITHLDVLQPGRGGVISYLLTEDGNAVLPPYDRYLIPFSLLAPLSADTLLKGTTGMLIRKSSCVLWWVQEVIICTSLRMTRLSTSGGVRSEHFASLFLFILRSSHSSL